MSPHVVTSSMGASDWAFHVARSQIYQGSGFGECVWYLYHLVLLGNGKVDKGSLCVYTSVVHQCGSVESSIKACRVLLGDVGIRRAPAGTPIRHDRHLNMN